MSAFNTMFGAANSAPTVQGQSQAQGQVAPPANTFIPNREGQDVVDLAGISLTDAEETRGYEDLINRGVVSRDQANAERTANGRTPLDVSPPRTEWEKSDARLNPQVRDISEYNLPTDLDGDHAQEIGAGLKELNLGRDLGSGFAQRSAGIEEKLVKMTPAQREADQANQTEMLVKLYAEDEFRAAGAMHDGPDKLLAFEHAKAVGERRLVEKRDEVWRYLSTKSEATRNLILSSGIQWDAQMFNWFYLHVTAEKARGHR